MRRNILFMVINMNIGGTEKALLNMIAEIPSNQYNITILMLEERGGFLNHIPKHVQVKYLNEYSEIRTILNDPPHIWFWDSIKKRKLFQAPILIFLYLFAKISADKGPFFKYVLRNYQIMDDEYDVAIAYAGPMDFISYFVVEKIAAKKKVQWIHFDVTKIFFNKKFSSRIYKKFDKVFSVSNEGRDKLVDVIPSLRNKAEVFFNVISPKLIHKQAEEGIGFQDQYKGLRILTVGRLSNEKGQDLAIQVLARLLRDGYEVKWYCVGEGSSRKEYERLIKSYGVTDKFILLGATSNPYSYLKQCDIYVQPSRYEGYCITLAEARCLQRAIVTTNFAGAKEQIKNSETGLIVRVDENEIYEAVRDLLDNPKLRRELSNNLAKENFGTTFEMKRFYETF